MRLSLIFKITLTLVGGSLFFLSRVDLTLTTLKWIAHETQYYYLIYELNKINNYVELNEEIQEIKKNYDNIINNIELIKNKIKQYNI